jgi:hypothetical protein
MGNALGIVSKVWVDKQLENFKEENAQITQGTKYGHNNERSVL